MEQHGDLEEDSVEDAVHRAIRDSILNSEFVPGRHLSLADLAQQLGVSTMPIRGALRRLAAEGLVQTFPRRGAVVSELSIHELEELHDLRVALETTTVRSAVLRIDDHDIDRMRRVREEYDRPATVGEYQALEWDAFLTCYRASGRTRSVQMIIDAAQLSDRYAKLVDHTNFDLDRARTTLSRLIQACEHRDRIEAADAVAENIEPALDAIREAILHTTRRSTTS